MASGSYSTGVGGQVVLIEFNDRSSFARADQIVHQLQVKCHARCLDDRGPLLAQFVSEYS